MVEYYPKMIAIFTKSNYKFKVNRNGMLKFM